MEAMFQLRIDIITVVKEISQISVVNKYSKAPDSGEAREVHLSFQVAACLLFKLPPVFFSTASRTEKQSGKEKRTLAICQIKTVDKKANHEFHDKMVFFLGGGGGWGGGGCFAHKSIYWLDFEMFPHSSLLFHEEING